MHPDAVVRNAGVSRKQGYLRTVGGIAGNRILQPTPPIKKMRHLGITGSYGVDRRLQNAVQLPLARY